MVTNNHLRGNGRPAVGRKKKIGSCPEQNYTFLLVPGRTTCFCLRHHVHPRHKQLAASLSQLGPRGVAPITRAVPGHVLQMVDVRLCTSAGLTNWTGFSQGALILSQKQRTSSFPWRRPLHQTKCTLGEASGIWCCIPAVYPKHGVFACVTLTEYIYLINHEVLAYYSMVLCSLLLWGAAIR